MAYFCRGSAYRVKGEYENAIADYTEAIRVDTTFAIAYLNRGRVYAEIGDYDRAITNYTEAIRLDPEYGATYWDRGSAYRAKGKLSSAQRDFAHAKKLGYEGSVEYERLPEATRREAEEARPESESEGTKVAAAWRTLRLGMSPAQVERLLGRPSGVETYPLLGQMT
jgi:tetratricopeptide (TPR) repeat protein